MASKLNRENIDCSSLLTFCCFKGYSPLSEASANFIGPKSSIGGVIIVLLVSSKYVEKENFLGPLRLPPNLDWRISMRCSLIASLSLALQLFSALPVQAEEKALFLKQSSFSVGNSETYLTSQAIRVNIGSDKIYLVAKAPLWKVVLYNSLTKNGLELPYERWISHHPKWNHQKDVDWVPDAPLLKVGSPLVYGRRCTDYILAAALPSGRLVPKTEGTAGHLIVSECSQVAPKAVHILQRTLDLPQIDGLPISLTISRKVRRVEGMTLSLGGDSHLVATHQIKSVTPPDSIFVYPKAYKKVSFETDVLFDPKTVDSNVEQFLDAFK